MRLLQDELIAQKCIEIVGCSRYRGPIVLEGGGIHTDGQGTCLVTEETLLHPTRNPGYSKDELEQALKQYINVQKVIWLKKGLYGDEDTNGHIDNICCFVKPAHVVLAWSDDENDPQYAISRDCYETLANATDARGRKIKVKLRNTTIRLRFDVETRTLTPCFARMMKCCCRSTSCRFPHQCSAPRPTWRVSSRARADERAIGSLGRT